MVSCLTVLGLLLASCAQAAPLTPIAETAPQAAPSPTSKPAAEQPRYGGILTTCARDDAPHFDPYLYRGIATQGITQPCYKGLLQYDPLANDKVILNLAKSGETSPDGLDYTFQISDGVRSHDSKLLTVEDVSYGLERIIFKAGKLAIGGTLPDVTKKVENAGKDTVRVTLSSPSAGFIPMMARGSMVIIPKAASNLRGYNNNRFEAVWLSK